ncbi:MAG: hypothetical protein HOG89_03635 [Candidatus Peribacter sp.]|nr:hypothetical protein [Candidatus Peribacter sp.]MBT4393060.1 hypothetical protein [Candidatus Peribacter sp.]MBT4600858.1 hypothetical protein [Candidatus Peribacter sp.]MBT5149011.1 hypothetical protein [Candidatus Peribacter sp.]MBT5638309.1 hypothetical protein [Candidatus Peribacter sp.]
MKRSGTTLIELLLFLAFFGLSSGVLLAFFFMTSEQRVRQQTIATVEQSGVQLIQTLTNRIRSSERILDPAIGTAGDILALQLADDTLYPTIIGVSGSVLYVGEANTLRAMSSSNVTVSNFIIRNTSSAEDLASVLVEFDVTRTVPLTIPLEYTRKFEALVPLFPDDQPSAPCSCASPSCSDGIYSWSYCIDTVCTDATVDLPCL